MPFEITIPFYGLRFRLKGEHELLAPVQHLDTPRLNYSIAELAKAYQQAFQEKLLDQGKLKDLLEKYVDGEYLKDNLQIKFEGAPDRLSYPEFSILFDYFYQKLEDGYWGIVPILGVEGFAGSEKKLKRNLTEGVRRDFSIHRRLADVRQIATLLWYDSIELEKSEIHLQVPYPDEVQYFREQHQDLWLPRVAQQLHFEEQVVFGRAEELRQLRKAMESKFGRNVLLVGPSGVGKTALVWEVSRWFRDKKHPKNVWETTASRLIKELTQDSGWEDNIVHVCQELAKTTDWLFVRNLMSLFEVGQYIGNDTSVGDYLLPYLSRGDISMIAECTEEELAQIEIRHSNYLSLFTIIRLEEPREELEYIIQQKIQHFSRDKKVGIQEQAIKEVIRLNQRFTPYAGMPGKPIRFLQSMLTNAESKKDQAIQISLSEVIQHFCHDTGMPVFMVDASIPMNTQRIREKFNNVIFGQEAAVDGVVDVLASVKTALHSRKKPIASFLFVGPTGVGKTELAKVLATFMFGDTNRMIRFDMTEYSSPYAVLRLTGYNYYSDGLLTSAIRRMPFTVLLFDEIEKADKTFLDLLLQILDDGRLTDGRGRLSDFCSTIIIMTSNIGADTLSGNRISIGNDSNAMRVHNHFESAVRKAFRPELFNRIDQIISFAPLDKTTVRSIVDREIEKVRKLEGIRHRNIDLHIEPEVLAFLGDKGYDPHYGARHLQRTIREYLLVPLGRQLNLHDHDDRLTVKVSLEKGRPHIHVEADPLALDLIFEELKKTTEADAASQQRSNLLHLEEGYLFVQLMADLEKLEMEQEAEKHFWKDQKKVYRYTTLKSLQDKLRQLKDQITDIERDLNLACLDLQDYHQQLQEKLDQWLNDFFRFKLDLVRFNQPGIDKCFFSICGRMPDRIVAFYHELIKSKRFEVQGYFIWANDQQGGNTFFKRPFEEQEGSILHTEEKGTWYGVEWQIFGPGAALFLHPEAGYQAWTTPNHRKTGHYLVRLSSDAPEWSSQMRSKGFFNKANYQRTVNEKSIKDTRLKINREFRDDAELRQLIAIRLEDDFSLALEQKLLH